MNARALGRFVGQFLAGLAEGDEAASAPSQPVVVPVADVRQAVADFLGPLVAEDTSTPSSKQLDIFADRIENAAPQPGDVAELTLQRLAAMRAQQAKENSGEMPEGYQDPNLPGSTGWASPRPA